MTSLEPRHVNHYIAACKVAGVPVALTSPEEMHALIERLSSLSIPDAVKLLRMIQKSPVRRDR